MRHLLLTRFNVDDGRGRGLHLDPAWLARRFALFEVFCLPSVLAQTSGRFTWLLFSDVRTAEPWRTKLKNAAFIEGSGKICETGPRWLDDMQTAVRNAGAGTCITSRVDSDDCLHADFMRTVQDFVLSPASPMVDDFLVDVPSGATFDARTAEMQRRSYAGSPRAASPFVTRVERWPACEPKTVFEHGHGDIKSLGLPLRELALDPFGWVQVLHGGNIANSPGEGAEVPDAAAVMQKWFGVPAPLAFIEASN